MVYNEHIFQADAETICLARTLKESSNKFFIIDTNNNPVEISDPADFLEKLISRNQEAVGSYHQMSKTFGKRDD